ncbi:uncharacterized protein LOC143180868 [Calliopsis andreniformis]|uniref:uncharacterized protein LOC143180868 n=1 Tax=Calliopsis andreniformis TaxID=337506 RepID=UPI003FCD226A
MESSPPNKKIRLMNSIDFPVIECRREFKLPQQFPSMVSSGRINYIAKGKNGANTVSVLGTKNINNPMSKEMSNTNCVKKLRIRSHDGKDLGEIKVKILPQNCMQNGKNITLTKSNGGNTLNKPIKFSIIPQNHADKCVSVPALYKSTEGSKIPETLVIAGKEKATVDDKNKKLLLQTVIANKPINRLNQNGNGHNEKALETIENNIKLVHNIQSPTGSVLKHVTLPISSYQKGLKRNGESITNKTNLSCYVDIPLPKDNITEIINKTSILNVKDSPTVKGHLELVKSKFPVVKCEKLMLSKSKININELNKFYTNVNTNTSVSSSVFQISAQKNNTEKQDIINNKIPHSIKSDTIKECNTNNQTKLMPSVIQKSHSTIENKDQHKTHLENSIATLISDKTTIVQTDFNNAQRKDCTVTPIINEDVHSATYTKQNISNNTNNKTAYLHGQVCNNENQNVTSNIQVAVTSTNNVKETVNDTSKQENLSQCLNTIKKALISVKDEELRTKALQALADCGIGLAKQVPITPPEKLKTVHDSQSQTDVFGLFESDNFVLVNKEEETLERIKQIERPNFHNEKNANLPVQFNNSWNNNIDNEDLYPRLHPVYFDDSLNLDDCFRELCSENTNAGKVNQILSTPHSLYKKVATQLQKDHERLQQCNEDGLLNIHIAVINDNLCEVQRLLMVMKAMKINIDVTTEDGMTSLELAIKFNSSRDIVHVLLEAGANPISAELLHESAIMLASKLSSPLLPDLLKYVTNKKLLNQVDSEGLAPLHYCALHGNSKGIDALIQAEAEINLRDNRSGRTPFFHALEQNHVSIAQNLLHHGAVANILNFSGQSILSIADEAKSMSLKTVLKKIIV